MAFLHEHIILPLSDLLKGESVHKYLRLQREAEGWGREKMSAFQNDRLHKLFAHAASEVPYYQDWFLDHCIDPATAALEQLPVVSKGIMRQEGIERFAAAHFPAKERIASRSSGSTGEPFTYFVCREAESVNTAAKLRTWYQGGYRLGDRYMKIANGSRHGRLKRLQDKVNNCLYVPFYSLDDEALHAILRTIEREKPLFIRAYPIPLYLLAQYRNNHPDGFHYHPKRVFTTGSTLPTTYREEIEKAFGCDIIDSYSCEGTPNTYETPAHDGYHVTDYYGIIEVLDNDNRAISDGIGRVVSTDLWNLAHPFIRYDTQDLVEVKGGKIQRIMGRESEVLCSADGTMYTNHNFSHYFTHEISGIDSYQIIKHRGGGITFRLVVNNQYAPENGRRIIDHWHQYLKMAVNIAIVDEIPLMHNNKRLTIINETTD